MKRKFTSLIVLLSAHFLIGNCQDPVVLSVIQQPPLQADAGTDARIDKGGSVTIGGNPSAIQGYGQYTFLWRPAEGLDDPTLANPKASPETTTTFTLTVTDANHCMATDAMTLTVSTTGLETLPGRLEIRCFPNPVCNELFVETDGISGVLTIKLFNTVGKELILQKVNLTGTPHREMIPVGEFPAGVYFLQMVSAQSTFYHSIIKNQQP